MLKLITNNVWDNLKSEKCGEIYYQPSKNFSIKCTVCALKAFNYDDFLRHFENVHLDKDEQADEVAIEVAQLLPENIKVEADVLERGDNLENILSLEYDSVSELYSTEQLEEEGEEEELRLMKWNVHKTDSGDLINDSADIDANDTSDDDEIYCPSSKQKRKSRKKKSESKEFKCDICNRRYKSAQNLTAHLKKGHETGNVNTKIKCEECDAEFLIIRNLEEHCVAVHGGMKCTYCDKRSKTRTNLQRHAEQHTHGNEKTFQCDIGECKKCFFTRRQWLAHRRTHTKSKNFVCDICGYCCREPDTLKVHYRTHTGEKPFPCKECGKCFVSTSAVKEHSASHTQERPHVCKVCGHTFARAKSLYHHSFLHLGEKKFKCKVCGNAYAQLAGLAGHMRKHKEEGFC